jgi:C4-dicarboxylate-specific signal transduction histidine kinase
VSEPPSGRLRDEGLAFFGRIAAGQSHELTNVLNIINELAGLQRDIIAAARSGMPPRLDKLWDTSERIRVQVERGQEIIRHVNHFAHSVDHPVTSFDLHELVERVAFLAGRHARLRRMALETALPEGNVSIEGSPFLLELALYCSIELVVGAGGESERVTVSSVTRADGVEITVARDEGVPVTDEVEARLELLRFAAEEMGARLAVQADSERVSWLSLSVPVHQGVRGEGERNEVGGNCAT